MNATTKVPITPIREYVMFMLISSYLDYLNCSISTGETGVALYNGQLSVSNMMSNTGMLHGTYVCQRRRPDYTVSHPAVLQGIRMIKCPLVPQYNSW